MKPLPALIALIIASVAFAADTPLSPPSKEVQYFDHNKTTEGFAKGSSMLANTAYKVSTYRRVTGGAVEIHELDTDILYVVKGSATFVTGGTPVNPKPSGPHETRAPSVNGGDSHSLTVGDLIVVPHGTPHWFKEVKGEIQYLGIKVTRQ